MKVTAISSPTPSWSEGITMEDKNKDKLKRLKIVRTVLLIIFLVLLLFVVKGFFSPVY